MRILELKDAKVNQNINGFIYLIDYKVVPYGDGTKFRLTATGKAKDIQIPVTSFTPKVIEYFNQPDPNPVIAISGTITEYQNKLSLTIKSIDLIEHTLTKFDFMKSIDREFTYNELISLVKQHLSPNHSRVFALLLKDYKDLYTSNFAGAKVHDAQVGGLMNHSLKMFKIALRIIENDNRLELYKDELLLGCLIHDFGKVIELDTNEYTKNSFITHRSLAIEILAQRKRDIMAYIGEDTYYRMLAIVQGHHNEYGDKATTMITYVIHLIDMLDSQVTAMLDMIDNNSYQTLSNGNKVLNINGNNLTI